MKTLIIPDIHNQYGVAEYIIEKEKHDRIIFLGDYFDSYFDSNEDANNAATWLSNSIKKKNRIHLIGNHDISYMTDNPKIKCSGYKKEKDTVINNHNMDWPKLKLYYWLDDWLCTHAGMALKFYEGIRNISKFYDNLTLEDIIQLSQHDLDFIHSTDLLHPFFQAGRARNGSAEVGGILWCDYNEEFKPIPGLKQIFGHTPLKAPSHLKMKDIDSEHICLDTGLRHYAIYENGEMQIKPVKYSRS